MRKLMKLWAVVLVTSLLAGSFLPAQTVEAAESTPTFAVDEDGNVNAAEDYDGPRIVKIRVLTEGNFLEIYWDRYVDENEAIDVDNFVLKGSVK